MKTFPMFEHVLEITERDVPLSHSQDCMLGKMEDRNHLVAAFHFIVEIYITSDGRRSLQLVFKNAVQPLIIVLTNLKSLVFNL